MKLFSDFGRFGSRQSKAIVVCLAFAMAMVAGCGKSGSTSATPAAPSSSPANAPPPAATPAAPAANLKSAAEPAEDDTKKQLQTLNRAMVGWMMKNHRRPQTFQEFANNTDVQIPAPPAGKKYAFDSRGFIVLVNSTP